jgi:hypothetical protein
MPSPWMTRICILNPREGRDGGEIERAQVDGDMKVAASCNSAPFHTTRASYDSFLVRPV